MSNNESPRQKLERLRAEVATQETAEAPVEALSPLRLPSPGEQAHCLKSGTMVHVGEGILSTGMMLTRGQTFIVTGAMIEASKNRFGEYTGVALLHDELRQFEMYGEILFSPGPAPTDLELWTRGDSDWADARELARREAHAQPTEAGRREALAAVHARFGAAPTTSVTLNSAPNATIRQAEEQQQQIAAKGVRMAWSAEAREAGAKR